MGYMTNITILNDHFEWIQENPQKFVDAIAASMNSGTESITRATLDHTARRHPRHESPEEREARIHYVTVHKAEHADVPQIVFSQYNATYSIGDLIWGLHKGYLEQIDDQTRKICEREYRRITDELRSAAKELDRVLDGKDPWS